MAPDTLLRIALVQQRARDDAGENRKRAAEQVRHAAAQGARLVCLQELFCSPYFPQAEAPGAFDLAETVPGPTTEQMSALAAELGVVLIVPVFERRAAGLFHNTAVVFDADGSEAGRYRKMHVPHDPLFFEKYYFTPGDEGVRAFDTAVGRIGVLICWDQWFPEAARLAALDGADVLLYPSAIAWSDGEDADECAAARESWIAVQRGHAIANGVFVCTTNRVGRERALTFYGSSFAFDPQGRSLGEASSTSEETLLVDCDLGRIESQRREWPFLRDRRIDAYGDLTRRYRK